MFDFTSIPDEERFGILPKGTLMKSPCGQFLWQLIEPDPWMDEANESTECLQRVGLGVPEVALSVAALKARGVEFVESTALHPEDRGALTRTALGSVSFELVHQAASTLQA
jgi:4-hydroxyphenylpyruvate dioxygenase